MKKFKILFLVSLVICLVVLGFVIFNDLIPIGSKEAVAQTQSQEVEPDKSQEPVAEQVGQTKSASAALSQQQEQQKEAVSNNKIICIDAGHQQKANMNKEPIGPGASKKKAKVDGGTRGRYTGLTEYQLNLDISLKLQQELESRGYTVVMVRTTNDVDISNSERATIANEAHADAFVRVHADGSDSTSVSGASTLCQTAKNPYNGALYEQSRLLSECVLNGVAASSGCKKRQVIETDKMTGINWSQVPSTIIEVGYLTNKAEEAKLNTDEYQTLIAKGIADGLDQFFQQ